MIGLEINIQIYHVDKLLLTLVTKVQKSIRRIDLDPTMMKRNVQHLLLDKLTNWIVISENDNDKQLYLFCSLRQCESN